MLAVGSWWLQAALDKSHAKRMASLAAAAFVLFFCGAAAASCCVSGTAAAGSINASEGFVRIGWYARCQR